MKYLVLAAVLSAVSILTITSCHTHSHDHSHGPAEPVPEPFVHTLWSSAFEFFVEFPPLVVGRESGFAAHFTDLSNYKAVEVGKAMVCLFKNKKETERNELESPSSPGIFLLGLTPKETGTFDLKFIISSNGIKDTFSIDNIPIYPDEEAALAAHPPVGESDDVSFLKEQAWKTDFAIETVQTQPIHGVIHTSGEIQPVKGEERILAAKTSGIVFFKSNKIQEGRDVRAGAALFSINSDGLVQGNLNEAFQVAQAHLEKSKTDFQRAEKLLAKQIIGQKEYEQRKRDFSVAQAEFETLSKNYQIGGVMLNAPISGIIKNVLVSDGQFVEEGAPLIEITSNRRLMIHADVSQQYFSQLHLVQSANFKTPYQKTVQSIDDYNGKLVSYGKMVEENSGFIPVLFELDNVGGLIPGAFVELFLLTNEIENSLVIPKVALMEDYGSHYVYVQKEGESFEKREVKLGIDEGKRVQILSGILEGERIVSKGAYHVKMASMSSSVPAHTH